MQVKYNKSVKTSKIYQYATNTKINFQFLTRFPIFFCLIKFCKNNYFFFIAILSQMCFRLLLHKSFQFSINNLCENNMNPFKCNFMKSTKRALLRVKRESLFFWRKSRETTTVRRDSFCFYQGE